MQDGRTNSVGPPSAPATATAEALNRNCPCVTLDRPLLESSLNDALGADAAGLLAERPHLFSNVPAFVSPDDFRSMAGMISAIEAASALAEWRRRVFARAGDAAARIEFGPKGVFMGYDFHLGEDGPKLIEVNTNAGGAYLNAALRRAQLECCMGGSADLPDFDRAVRDMFLEEWRLAGRAGAPHRAAIVDDSPQTQYLYPEFLLAARHFRKFGIDAMVADAADLEYDGRRLIHRGETIELVYNRLVDFSLADPKHGALRAAYLDGAVVVTPSPDRHALLADKRNLVLLSDRSALADWGLRADHLAALEGVPRTVTVEEANADSLWAERRRLVFKPVAGAGGKGVWRGDKITRGVWRDVIAGGYVAQDFAPPCRRSTPEGERAFDLKMDVRVFAYSGRPLLLAARLYEGQTTNFRTPGGGFAPIHIL